MGSSFKFTTFSELVLLSVASIVAINVRRGKELRSGPRIRGVFSARVAQRLVSLGSTICQYYWVGKWEHTDLVALI